MSRLSALARGQASALDLARGQAFLNFLDRRIAGRLNLDRGTYRELAWLGFSRQDVARAVDAAVTAGGLGNVVVERTP